MVVREPMPLGMAIVPFVVSLQPVKVSWNSGIHNEPCGLSNTAPCATIGLGVKTAFHNGIASVDVFPGLYDTECSESGILVLSNLSITGAQDGLQMLLLTAVEEAELYRFVQQIQAKVHCFQCQV